MSTRRLNELRGEEVVYAVQRQERTFLPAQEACPLCPTRPGRPPTEIPLPAYEIVVFDNRFPAFEAGDGAAEVVVYTDQHDAALATLPAQRARDLMRVWRHRYAELARRPEVEYVYIFENRGVEVGVTLHHPHGQIYGYPFMPPVAKLELSADQRVGGCTVCAERDRGLAGGERLLIDEQDVVVYVPFAARWPYEVHLAMREHRNSLLDCTDGELDSLAGVLQRLLRGFDALFERPFPYVMAVHQAPAKHPKSGHLHIEFYPPLRSADKLKFLAGSEQGAGTFISDVLPEAAAGRLREAVERAG